MTFRSCYNFLEKQLKVANRLHKLKLFLHHHLTGLMTKDLDICETRANTSAYICLLKQNLEAILFLDDSLPKGV